MNRRFIGRLIFCGEWLLFIGIYWFSAHGERSLVAMRQKNATLASTIEQANNLLQHKRERNRELAQSSFFKEKVARENLHMAYPDEIIYYSS